MDRVLKDHFDGFMGRGELPPELCENTELDCEGMKLFDDEAKLKVWRNNFKGVSWTDEGGNELAGAIDNLLVRGDKCIVLDYKTRGFPLKEDTAEHYRLQQNIYNFLLRKNGYQTEDFTLLLFYIPSSVKRTGEVVFDSELVKMEVDVGMVEKTWEGALTTLNGSVPNKSCEWCVRV